jgi:uridine kinase
MLKSLLPRSEQLLQCLQDQLGPNHKPLLIAVDGADGVGKSSLASWLGWQLGMPAVHLDLYLLRDSKPLQWRTDELARIIGARVDCGRPIIVEGIFVLDVLEQIQRSPDFLVYISGEGGHGLSNLLSDYCLRQKPEAHAQFSLEGVDGRS